MSTLSGNGLPNLSTCGCCEGVEQVTPMTIANRPGLNALAYRVGIHATFLETMLARLSNMGIPLGELNTILDDLSKQNELEYPLNGLTTRSTDDPSIALLDASAALADVLTFYQERIANEGYLRTATERRSLVELARLVGYALRPGVDSSVFLSYTLDKGRTVTIPKGSRSQNIPAPGQLPQSFETSFDFTAHGDWNAISPRMSVPQYITEPDPTNPIYIDTDTADGSLYLNGISTQIKPNDVVLFVFGNGAGQQVPGHALTITPNAAQKYTQVTFPPIFTPNVFYRRLLNTIEYYLNVSLFNVSSNDSTVASVINDLTELQTDVQKQLAQSGGSGTGGSGATGGGQIGFQFRLHTDTFVSVHKVINNWDTSYLAAVNSQNDAVASWVGALVNDMETLVLTVLPETVFLFPRPIVTTSISALVGPLAKPPSLQPTNGTRLQRTVQGEFARNSSIALQMLGVLNPNAQSSLVNAVSNASVTAGSPLQNLYAMRVKASPFGSTAPKQAIPEYNRHNQITGTKYQEWQLTDSITLSLHLNSYATGDTNLTGTISYSQNDTQVSQDLTLPIPQSAADPFPSLNTPFTITVTAGSGAHPPLTAVVINIAITSTINQTVTLTLANSEWLVEVTGGDKLHYASVQIGSNTSGTIDISMTVPKVSPLILDLDARYDQIVQDSWVVIEYPGSLKQTLVAQVTDVQSVARADYGIAGKITRLTLDQPWLTGSETLLSDIRNVVIYAQSDELQPADEPLTDDIQGDTIELDNLYDGLQSGQWTVVSGERTDIVNTSGIVTSELAMIASVEQNVRKANSQPPPASSSTGSGGSSGSGGSGNENGNSNQVPQSNLPNDKTHTFLHLASPLAYTYKRATVAVNANVVRATQGATQNEVLGSGNGTVAMQQFTLKQSPLTYVAAPTPEGAASTLAVYVNNVQWHEVKSLETQGPKARVFITKTDDKDKTTVIFGDGQEHGARPPTGVENITATYRSGIGTSGNVDAGQISLLVTRPSGVKAVNNPGPATGGADRENTDQARRNVPLATQTLGRIVSVQDYADFARTFAGIGKASALTLPDIHQQIVHLTIAGQENIPIDPTSDLFNNLYLALRTLGNPSEPLKLAVSEVKLLIISMRVRILPDYKLETVSPAIRAALLNAFSFDQRDLGQPVYQSEVLSVIQQVPGVEFVDLDILDAIDQQTLLNALTVIHQQELQAAANGTQPDETQDLANLLNLRVRQTVPSYLARVPRNQPGVFLPAQLVFLSADVPDTLIINELTSTHVALKSRKKALPGVRG